ncbi:MAG: hypothetical protein JEY96_14875 [Bacteroidales bacterium]|nr:hypothetical protein [Bacteroidales bacterium]
MKNIIEIRETLIESTRKEDYIKYQDFADKINSGIILNENLDQIKVIGDILSIVSIFEFVKRGVLLSGVVSTNGMPGNGFYKLMNNLDIKDPNKDKIWSMAEQIIKNKKFWKKDRNYRKYKDDLKGLEQLEIMIKNKVIDITKDITPHFRLIKSLTK